VNSTFRTAIRQTLRNGPSNSSPGNASKVPIPIGRTALTRGFASFGSFALSFFLFGLAVHAAAPVAVNDTFVVDAGGTLTVRASFPDTVTALDPSLYWRFNDTTNNAATTTIDRGSDSISSGATYTSTANSQSGAPVLRASNGFKGFTDSNTWFGFGSSGSNGYLNTLITPSSGWGSDLGAISFWFKTGDVGGDTTNNADSGAYHSPRAFFAGVSEMGTLANYGSPGWQRGFYKTAVLLGMVDGKVIFRVAENDVAATDLPVVEFLTTKTYNDNAWHHVAASWNNTTNESALYIDGGSLGGATKSETVKSFDFDLASDFDFSGASIRVGSGNDTTYNSYNGFMDEFAIWEHKTLTAENARDLYFSALGGLLANDSDADGDALTATKLTDPSAGTLTFNASGAFTYDSTGASSGPQTFTYKVNDGGSDSNVATVTIQVNGPPTGANDSGYSVGLGSVLSVNAAAGVLANDSDPNGDTLSAFLASTPANGVLTLNADGSFDYNATGTSGVKTFTYKVSDGSYEAGPYTVTITVQSANVPSYSNLHGDGVTFTGGGSAVALDSGSDSTVTDADTPVFNGGTLTLSVASGGVSGEDVLTIPHVGTSTGQIGVAGSTIKYGNLAIGTFTGGTSGADLVITFNNGTGFNTTDATLAAVQALGRVITYSAGASPTVQNRTVTYSLNDGSNAGTATVNVTVAAAAVNNAPVITSNGGGPTASVSVAENQTAVTTVVAVDADGDTLSYTISGGADQSKFDLNSSTGALTFKAAPDYETPTDTGTNNTYVVEVNVSDGTVADTQTFTVTVTGVDDPPVVANAIGDVTATEDAADGTISLANVFNDVDDANASITKTVQSNTNAGLVTATIVGDVLTLDFQPDQFGNAIITVRGTSNGQFADDNFTVTVAPVDDAPVVATPIPDVNALEDDADRTIDLSNVFNDIDDDNASIVKSAASGDPAVVVVSVSGNTLTLDYQPDAFGSSVITVLANINGKIASDNFTVTVTGVNDPPVFTSTEVTSARADVSYVYNVRANDPDGNATLTLSSTSTPSWLAFTDQGSGMALLSGTPAEADIGSYNVSLRALDANGTYADQNFTIVVTPANYAPVIKVSNIDVSSTSVTMVEDNASTFSLTGLAASDQDDSNATLVWSVDTNPSNGTAVVVGTGTSPSSLAYVPDGNFSGADSFVIKATDARGGIDTINVNVTVAPVDDAPTVAAAITDVSVLEDAADTLISLANVFNDADDANASITKTVQSNSNAGLVTAAIAGDVLTLDYQADQNGSATITIRATSNVQFVDDSFTVTVSAANASPVIIQGAGPITVVMSEDGAPTAWVAPELNATDADTVVGSLTWNRVGNPANGSASVSGSGASPTTFNYIPNTHFNGTDSFEVRVRDGNQNDDLITINVTVLPTPDPPEIVQGEGPYKISVPEDSGTNSFLWDAWDKHYGGSGNDNLKDLVATADGGFLLAGRSNSDADGDKSEAGRGGLDYWAVKVDANGSKIWDKRFGSSANDELYAVAASSDGGYILAGSVINDNNASDGDLSEASRNGIGMLRRDYWVVKVDANGSKLWDKRFGGNSNDFCYDVVATADGGCLLVGYSQKDSGNTGDRTEASRGNDDYWVVRVDANGNKLWDKSFGGTGYDQCRAAVATPDGGFLLAGKSQSSFGGDKTETTRGNYDYWAVRIDADGNKVWDKTFGGDADDDCYDVAVTADGGFLLAGYSHQSSGLSDDRTEGSRGGNDYWAVKIDANGHKVWDRTFGGSSNDYCYDVVAALDGGFLLAGKSHQTSQLSGDRTEASRGGEDYWAVRVDADGNKLWDKTLGGKSYDILEGAAVTADGGFLLAGRSNSNRDGDKMGSGRGNWDFWVAKITDQGKRTLREFDFDGDGDLLTWSLTSSPSHGTAVVSGVGLSPAVFTYQPNSDYMGADSFSVQVTDGNATDSITVNVTVSPVNDIPVFADANATASIAENFVSSFFVTATDADANTTLVYSKSGPDAGLFTLNVATGQLNFTSPPNFEIPADADVDNVYEVTVTASDGVATASQHRSITVTDVVEQVMATKLTPQLWAELNATVNALILAREQQREAERNANPGPRFLTYVGRITVDGEPFTGVGQFKYAFVNGDGSQTYWTHDGNATDGEPASGLSLDVSQGVYSIRLGDSAITGMAPLAPEVFQGRSDVRLRIWFARPGGSYELLSPDQPVSAVPYAFPAP
jgi:hypothetical protein